MLYQQARLHDRGAAEMVLQMISATKGKIKTRIDLSCSKHTSSQKCYLCSSRSPRRYGHIHAEAGDLHPQRGEHSGPAGLDRS